ncbi:MAG: hypothetical protein QM765_18970 [Myxococcales bacterium]
MAETPPLPEPPEPPAPAAPPVAQTPRTTTTAATYKTALWSNLVSLAIVLWFCLRELDLAFEARGRVAALLALPPWWLYAGTLLLSAAALVAAVVSRVRRLPPDRPPYRLLPVIAVLLLAVQVFAVPQSRLPLPADEVVLAQASLLEAESFVEEDGLFTTAPERIQAGLGPFEAPFLGRDGEPLGHWRPVVRTNCAGPALEVPAAMEAGTLLYCVSSDRTNAWLSFVGLEGLAGSPRVVQLDEGGATVSWEQPKKKAPPEPETPEPSPSEPPKAE